MNHPTSLVIVVVFALSCVFNDVAATNEYKIFELAKCFNDSFTTWQEQNRDNTDSCGEYYHHHVHSSNPCPPMQEDTLTCLGSASSCFDANNDHTNTVRININKVNDCIQERFRRTLYDPWRDTDDMGSSIEGYGEWFW